jgi:hypothetical protein
MPDLYLATQMFTIYAKREDAPKSFKDAKDANYTFHHIMPYCYAALIGHVVDTVIRKGILDQEDATARTLAGNLDLLCSTLIASEYSNFDVRRTDPNDPKQSFVHKFAWMGANLFMGPEGQWRLDDPKHDCEANRPCSFDRDAWQQLMDIHKLLDQSFDVRASGQGYTATPKMNLAWTGPGNFLTSEIGLVRRLKSVVTGYSHTPHPFNMDDWIVVDSDAPEWKRTELKLTDDEVKIGQAKQTLLNLELQHKVNYLRPVAIKGVDREYPNMAQASRARQGQYRDDKALTKNHNEDLALEGVKNLFASPDKRATSAVDDWKAFWRLRKESEPLASLPKIKANFRIGGMVTPDKYT